jgi:plastocyanin
VSSIDKTIIIPKNTNHEKIEQFFTPRFMKITKGETVTWKNFDSRSHTLFLYHVTKEDGVKPISKLGPILPNRTATMKIDYDNIIRIDYYCENHKRETGSIVILPKAEELMSNTEQLRFLTEAFDIKLPDFLKHLQ